jgi:hypothetical protein
MKRIVRKTTPNVSSREETLEKELATVRCILRETSKQVGKLNIELKAAKKAKHIDRSISLEVAYRPGFDGQRTYVRDAISGRSVDNVTDMSTDIETLDVQAINGETTQRIVTGRTLTLKVALPPMEVDG